MLSCYRKGDAENPDIYASAIAAVLADYPVDVIRRATDPRTGIAGKLKWLPSVAEVRECCEGEYAPIRRDQERERLAEDRKRMLPPPTDERAARLSYDELKEKYGQNWGLDIEERKSSMLKEIEAASRAAFVRECERDGVDPSLGVSPSLLKILNG